MPGRPVPPVDQDALRSALNRYLLARRRPVDLDELLAARAALVHLMEDAGWQPPAAVRAAVDEDPGRHRRSA